MAHGSKAFFILLYSKWKKIEGNENKRKLKNKPMPNKHWS